MFYADIRKILTLSLVRKTNCDSKEKSLGFLGDFRVDGVEIKFPKSFDSDKVKRENFKVVAILFDELVAFVEVHEEGFEAVVDAEGVGGEINVEEDVGEDEVDDVFVENVKFI